jgi:hypothetical protein
MIIGGGKRSSGLSPGIRLVFLNQLFAEPPNPQFSETPIQSVATSYEEGFSEQGAGHITISDWRSLAQTRTGGTYVER